MKTAKLYIRKSKVRKTCASCGRPMREVQGQTFYTIGHYAHAKYRGIFVASQAACIACTRDRLLVLSPDFPGGEVW